MVGEGGWRPVLLFPKVGGLYIRNHFLPAHTGKHTLPISTVCFIRSLEHGTLYA